MGSSSWVHLERCAILRETESAFLILIDEDGQEEWIPKSQIHPESVNELAVGDEDVTVTISEWIADKKGLTP